LHRGRNRSGTVLRRRCLRYGRDLRLLHGGVHHRPGPLVHGALHEDTQGSLEGLEIAQVTQHILQPFQARHCIASSGHEGAHGIQHVAQTFGRKSSPVRPLELLDRTHALEPLPERIGTAGEDGASCNAEGNHLTVLIHAHRLEWTCETTVEFLAYLLKPAQDGGTRLNIHLDLPLFHGPEHKFEPLALQPGKPPVLELPLEPQDVHLIVAPGVGRRDERRETLAKHAIPLAPEVRFVGLEEADEAANTDPEVVECIAVVGIFETHGVAGCSTEESGGNLPAANLNRLVKVLLDSSHRSDAIPWSICGR